MNGETRTDVRAILEGWPMPAELLAKCVERLEQALESSSSPRDVARIVACFAKLQSQNIQVHLGQRAIDAVGESAILASPQELLSAMVASLPLVPPEYTGETIEEAEKPEWPSPALPAVPASCPE
jgi:hypothetical protein